MASRAASLPTELLLLIVAAAPERERPARALASLAAINRHWRRCLTPALWAALVLRPHFVSAPAFAAWMHTTLDSAHLLAAVRSLSVVQPLHAARDHTALILALLSALADRPAASGARRLRSLSLCGLNLSTLERVAPLVSPELAVLHIAHAHVPAHDLKTVLLPRCSSLVALRLEHVSTLDDLGVLSVAFSCPALASVSFAGCQHVTDLGIKAIAESCPRITSIDVSGTGISVAAVFAIADRCGRRLEHLAVAGCALRKADTRMLAAALAGLVTIQSLDVSCTSAGWPALAIASVPLVPTDTSFSSLALDDPFGTVPLLPPHAVPLPPGAAPFHSVPTLADAPTHSPLQMHASVSASGDSPVASYPTISHSQTSIYAHTLPHPPSPTQFPNLTSLRIGFHGFLDESDCRRLFSRLGAPLKRLWFADITPLSPRALKCILERCRGLTHLHLPSLSPIIAPSNTLLNPSALIMIPSKCGRTLTHLSLVGHAVSADVLRALALACADLVALDISLARRTDPPLDATAIRDFVAACRKIEVIGIAGIGLDTKSIKMLQRTFPCVHFDLAMAAVE
ncbi:hypothetical protein HK105_200265 [Polyrhizophydium stewartii]|uniref:F-box domain-containing protein n=1 Tax=Polyrhizophydium stewartii TaxID=2732419 RepID=A0ABR4NKY4_9FUNG|nr:hypothetical protein HK105_005189 [Polyrhizophydium stewartii]